MQSQAEKLIAAGFRREEVQTLKLKDSDEITAALLCSVNRTYHFQEPMWLIAAKKGDIALADLLLAGGLPVHEDTFLNASNNGYYDFVRHLAAKGIPVRGALQFAIRRENPAFARWCLEQGDPITPVVTFKACCYHLQYIQLLEEFGMRLTAEVMALAAARDNIKVMEWLKSKGCPMDSTAYCGGQNCHIPPRIETMQWLLDNGCPKDKDAIRCRVMDDHLQEFDFLVKNDFPLI